VILLFTGRVHLYKPNGEKLSKFIYTLSRFLKKKRKISIK
jgi:hypothetical protein